jgi:hypothetical protein
VVSITPRPRFTPRGKGPPGTHFTGGWVGPRAGLDIEARGKVLCPRRESNPDHPVVQPVVRHYTAWATPADGNTRVPRLSWPGRTYSLPPTPHPHPTTACVLGEESLYVQKGCTILDHSGCCQWIIKWLVTAAFWWTDFPFNNFMDLIFSKTDQKLTFNIFICRPIKNILKVLNAQVTSVV